MVHLIIKNEFQDLKFIIVNNIEINLSIKVKNIIGGGGFASRMNMFKKKSDNTDGSGGIISTGAGVSIKDRLKFLKNTSIPQGPHEPKEKAAPKKIKIPTQLNNALMQNHGLNNNKILPKENNIEKEKKKVEEKKIDNKDEGNKDKSNEKIKEIKNEENKENDNKKEELKEENKKEEQKIEENKKEEEQEKEVEKEIKENIEEKNEESNKLEEKEENKEEVKEEQNQEKKENGEENKNEKIEIEEKTSNNEEEKAETKEEVKEEKVETKEEEKEENKIEEKEENNKEEKEESKVEEKETNENKEEEKEENKEEVKEENKEEEKDENKEIEQIEENEEKNEDEKTEDKEKKQNEENIDNNKDNEEKTGDEKEMKEIQEKNEEEENDQNIEEKNENEEEIEKNKEDKEEDHFEEKNDIEQNKDEEEKHEESENKQTEEEITQINNDEQQQDELNKSKEERENQEENINTEEKKEELIKEENKEESLKNSEQKIDENENDVKEEIKEEKKEEIKKEEKKEEKEDNKEKLKKEEIKKENNKNIQQKLNTKRASCILPSGGFKNVLANMEKNKKAEENKDTKKAAPKKLDANKFKQLIGERLIGQFMKKPTELNKKKEEQTPPSKTPPIPQNSSVTQNPPQPQNSTINVQNLTPTQNSSVETQEETKKPIEEEFKLLKSETIVEKRGKFSLKTEKESRKNTTVSPEQRNPVVSNFGFEVLDSFYEEMKQSSTENTSSDSSIEGFLDSMNYEDFLNDLKKQGIKEDPRESFCEGFFIASFPKKDGKVIENSAEKLPASCGHRECTKLPSMKPEIIMRYPLKDTKNLELNNLAATICFPTGIKLCYSENNYPAPIKDYVTQITNQKGERYYMRTFHFYHKMQNIDFTKEYEIHPLKHHLMKFADEYTVLSEDKFTDVIVNNIQKNLEFCQELGFRDIVYIPYCLCLISKYSYTRELETCLNTIYKIMSQKPGELNFEINELIMYLIHSIPIPIKNMRVRFYIPYNSSKLELLCPKVDDVSTMNSTFTKLFDYLSVDNIILVFRLLLSEKKVLFIHDDYTDLTNITDSFISLLYPFKWVHTYIPIMSDQMLKYLETFLPFLNGIHESLMKFVEDVFKEGELEDSDEVFLIYIKKDEIKLSSSLKKNKVKLNKYLQNNVLPLPFEKDLKKELKSIESQRKSSKRESKINGVDVQLENKMRDAFIDVFVKMFHDYEKYTGILDDDVIFNKVLFMNSISSKDEKFYDEFIDCQLFQQFTQNLLKGNCSYFNKKIKEYKEKKKKEKKSDKNNRTSFSVKQEFVYLIKPDYLGVKENDKNAIESKINSYKIENETQEIKNKILGNVIQIDPEKYINSNCIIYLIPEKKEATEETKNNLQEIKGTNNSIGKKTSTLISGGELTEKQIDKIKDDIKDMVIKIFKSEIESSDNKTLKTEAFRNLEISYGRTFFVSLISNNNNNIISLQENSFGFLENLIYGILTSILKLAETEQIIEEVVILIKSTKFFQKEIKKEKGSKKKVVNLFQSMKKKLQNYNKINQKNLWQKWFELSLKKLDEEQQNDKVKQELIISTCKEMLELEISKSIIKNVCDNINKSIFQEGSEIYENTKQSYIKLITQSQFISTAAK